MSGAFSVSAEPERRPRVHLQQQQQYQESLLFATTAAAAAAASKASREDLLGTPVIVGGKGAIGGEPTAGAGTAQEGTEVPDTEALPVLVALNTVPEEDYSASAAYKLLPHSAPPRKSQAVKVDAASGEICYFLPKGRKDLGEFPIIELLFLPALSPGQSTDASTAGDYWVSWPPYAYLYGKGNEHDRCLAVNEDSSSHDNAVLGSSFFIGKDVIVHVQEEVVGFAEADCPSVKLRDRPELPRLR